MRVVILAGGMGTRLSEETDVKPKPMVEIGGRPILWHIMKIYSHYGFNDFVLCVGYLGHVIKEYFQNYALKNSDIVIDESGVITFIKKPRESWRVTIVDTGINAGTADRIRSAIPFVGDKPFCLTYGDGVANVDIKALVDYHTSHGEQMTMTVIQPDNKLGIAHVDGNGYVSGFREKPPIDGWSNGGFFVMDKRILNYIENEKFFEGTPILRMAQDRQIKAYRHSGYWQCVDTLREKQQLEALWNAGTAPWKVWSDE